MEAIPESLTASRQAGMSADLTLTTKQYILKSYYTRIHDGHRGPRAGCVFFPFLSLNTFIHGPLPQIWIFTDSVRDASMCLLHLSRET